MDSTGEGRGWRLGSWRLYRVIDRVTARFEERPLCTCPWPHDELARREWPHVPLSLARAYAEEYVQTGRRP